MKKALAYFLILGNTTTILNIELIKWTLDS